MKQTITNDKFTAILNKNSIYDVYKDGNDVATVNMHNAVIMSIIPIDDIKSFASIVTACGREFLNNENN